MRNKFKNKALVLVQKDKLEITKKEIGNIDERIERIIKNYENSVDPKMPIKNEKFKIDLISKITPNLKPFKIPIYQNLLLEKEIRTLLEEKIIRESDSNYSSPCFIQPKSDETGRLLIDYSELNKITVKSQYYFPPIYENLHKLREMKVFSKLI